MAAVPPQLPAPPRALPATEVLVGRIGWLIRLRWLAIAATFAFVEGGRRFLPLRLEPGRLYPLLAALALYNLIAWLVLRRVELRRAAIPPPARDAAPAAPGRMASFLLPRSTLGARHYDRNAGVAAAFALVQIALDLFFLALLLHLSGGIENPLWVFFVFHVIVSSVLLSRHATYGVALYGTLLLWGTILGEYHGWLPHHTLGSHLQAEWYLSSGLLAAHLFLQAVTLFTAAYLASSIAGRLRRREMDVMVLSWHFSEQAQELEHVCAELRAAEQARSQYMRKVAHELRAPLATIKTALTLVLDAAGEGMNAQTRHLIQRAERRIGELADMTRALLSLSRSQGGVSVETVQVSLPALLQPIVEELRARADDAQLNAVIELPPALPVVLADPEGLTDLLVNLTGNAIRYTPPGGVMGLRLEWGESGLHIEVWDTGIGIREADLPRIFDEFYRAPEARDFAREGSGLGLAIVMAVVKRHGGTLHVRSTPGEGTQFVVDLPLAVLPQVWQPA